MPSASTNNNKNKLMKQASFGCSSGNGGGGGGPGGSASASSINVALTASSSSGTSKTSLATSGSSPSNVSITVIETNNNGGVGSSGGVSGSGSNNAESVGSNHTISSSTGKGAIVAVGGPTSETAMGNPMRQALITIEHKIRNLEKRKTKLESYRSIQANGKELSSDQKAAVAKYDAVMATLDFARDLSKQMVQFSKDAEKEQKKQARKEMIAKAQAETAKIREVLVIQNILTCFADDSVRSDFLNGENGAIKLEPTDIDAIEQFSFDVQTRRPESVDDPSFISVAQKIAENFSMTIDGRPKQYGETTFENLRRVFTQIQECGYLDKIYLNTSDSSNVGCNDEEITGTGDIAIVEEKSSRLSNALDDNMEKLHVTEPGVGSNARNTPVTNYVDTPDCTLIDKQSLNKEQMDQRQKQNVINTMSMPQASPSSVVSGATPMAGVNNYTAPMPPPPNRQQSGTTTPVHVAAIYAPQAGGPPQPVPPPQMQQVVPPTATAMISGLPPQQPAPVGIAPQHRASASGVNVQLPPGVSSTMPPPMHAGPPPPGAHYPLTTVHAVEQDFFKQHQQQQKYVQQMRPLAEVIGAGSFYFLQDSELDSPEIIGGGNNGGSGGVVFESPAANLLVHVSDVPLTGAAVDLQQQQQSKKLVAQQPPLQQQQQQVDAQHRTLQHQQQTPQSQQQQQPLQSQPITTQTFTNQTFPPIQSQPQPPTQLQRHEPTTTISTTGSGVGSAPPGVSKTPTVNSGSNGNTPTAQLFQPPQGQPGPHGKVAMYSPDLVIANKGAIPPPQQQQPIMIMTRLAPMQAGANAPQQQPQQPLQASHAGFSFDPMVATFGGYEQVQQLAAQKLTAGNVSNVEDKSRKLSGDSDVADAVPVVNDWEATIKGHASRNAVNSNAAKAAALTSALKQHSSGAPVVNSARNSSPLETTTNKWSTEMNALGARGNTPPSVTQHNTNNNQNQNRKNDWSTTSGNGNSHVGGTSYGSDAITPHSESHWKTPPPVQQSQQNDNNTYGRSGGGGSGRNSNNAYQRRNDDRRGGGDRNAGGGGNNNYRNRSNNYGGGGAQSQQQNSSGRGGGGGMYFRNNDNSQTGTPNSFYQNGGLYTKDGGNGPRYDNGGSNNYRGPRGSGSSNQRNQGPPRNMGRNSGSNGNNTSTGGGGAGGVGYIHPRQANRMPLGLEKN